MRTISAILLMLAIASIANAQNNDFEEYKVKREREFNNYKETRRKEFEEFRRKRNEEFAKYISKDWQPVEPSPVVPRPKDETVPPVVIPKEEVKPVAPVPTPIPFEEVVLVPAPKPQPRPIDPIEEVPITPVTPAPPTQAFTFFGTSEKVRFDKQHLIRLSALNESAIAKAWLKLSEESYTNLIHDCLEARENHTLCDWAYLMMLQQMAEAIYGKDTNEAVLLMAYVYCQSGYKMRLAIGGNKLYMMFASDHIIYNWNYYTLGGERYYTYNNKSGNVRICKQEYPQEQSMSLLISKEQKLALTPTNVSSHQSVRNKEIEISMKANQNMLDFYSSYPSSEISGNFLTRWAIYANMPMPSNIKGQVYPQLKKAVEGVDQLTAVNRILNWVQTGFAYEYDNKVWGHDRAFFPEESLHYPYCDCEDRSILLTRIIRDILGLKCILIYYPGHLASAIEITQGNPTGDYIQYQNRRFFIADGTIVGHGASVGKTMSGMNNASAKIILLE